MKKIESLTEEQKAKFPAYVREWTDIGLCTDPADRTQAEVAVKLMYRCAGLAEPLRIVWCGSPFALVKKQAMAETGVLNALQSPVASSAQKAAGTSDCVYGQHDANWLAFYAFMRDELGLKDQTAKLAGLIELAKSAGWALPYERACYVSERHDTVKKDNAGRLHCLEGPAVRYPDGWGVYAVRGTRVPKEWVEGRATLNPMIALTTENMDLRSAAAILIGWDRIIAQLKPRVVDTDPDPSIGELLEIDLPDEPGQKFLRARCGTGRLVTIRVHPSIKTALEAGAWSYGLAPKDYMPEVRT